MKSIMMSTRPQYCSLIANRHKTVEIRKTRPRAKLPFKVYIYCTKNTEIHLWRGEKYFYTDNHSHTDPVILANTSDIDCNGKVIGEFICDEIRYLDCDSTGLGFHSGGLFVYLDVVKWHTGLSREEIRKYTGDERCYGLHISNLILYDKPKELSEFGLSRAPQSWRYVN